MADRDEIRPEVRPGYDATTKETETMSSPDSTLTPTTGPRRPDALTLVVGLATLVMAVFAFVGELPDLSGFDPRWLLATGAAAVGLILLVSSLRSRSGGRRNG